MAEHGPLAAWRAFLARPNTDMAKTLGVAFLVALGCSIVVSLAAVTLKPIQEANRLRASAANMLEMTTALGLPTPQMRLVDRRSGDYAARESQAVTELKAGEDPAGLREIADVLRVFEVRDGQRLRAVILPVQGAGYKSTIKGFLALRDDLNTVAALSVYEQDETPGMGGRITETAWQDLWRDKKIAAANGTIRIRVVKGGGSGVHEVDGISGATRTGNGVSALIQFWMGPEGYGPYLDQLRGGGER